MSASTVWLTTDNSPPYLQMSGFVLEMIGAVVLRKSLDQPYVEYTQHTKRFIPFVF